MTSTIQREIARVAEIFPVEQFPGQATRFVVHLMPKVDVTVDLRRYPRRPKFSLPKALKKILGKPAQILFGLLQWDRKAPFPVVSVLEELHNHIENVAGKKVRIHARLAKGLCLLGERFHPDEFIGLVRMKGGVLMDYVLAPGAQSGRGSAFFSPRRLHVDHSLVAVVHSHPSGNLEPSLADKHAFMSKPYNLIVGYPYRIRTMVCYDAKGRPVQLEIVDRTPYDAHAAFFEKEVLEKIRHSRALAGMTSV